MSALLGERGSARRRRRRSRACGRRRGRPGPRCRRASPWWSGRRSRWAGRCRVVAACRWAPKHLLEVACRPPPRPRSSRGGRTAPSGSTGRSRPARSPSRHTRLESIDAWFQSTWNDEVVEPSGAGGGQRLRDPSRGEAALALDDVHLRGVLPVVVAGPEGEADRARHPDAGGAGGESDERRGRGRVPVEGLRPVLEEERGPGEGVATEAEEVFETQAVADVLRKEPGVRHPGHLVAQGPHGVEAHGLVAGGVRDDVGVVAVGLPEVVVHAGRREPRPRCGPDEMEPPGMTRLGDVVVEQRTERAVDEIEGLELAERRRDRGAPGPTPSP